MVILWIKGIKDKKQSARGKFQKLAKELRKHRSIFSCTAPKISHLFLYSLKKQSNDTKNVKKDSIGAILWLAYTN